MGNVTKNTDFIENVRSQNILLAEENKRLQEYFNKKIVIKQELFEANLDKAHLDYDNRIKNIDEERDYLMEEIRIKNEEITKKDELLTCMENERNGVIKEKEKLKQ